MIIKSSRNLFKNAKIPYLEQQFKFKKYDAIIKNSSDEVVFEQKNVMFPESFSQNAVNIVASKYFRLDKKTGVKECSFHHMVKRVIDSLDPISKNYFDRKEHYNNFKSTLYAMLMNQMYAFNSPVWFNLGAVDNPQCSACFIQGVEDSIESIFKTISNEAIIYKNGSGSGSNISKLRGKNEKLSRGGTSSGSVSFMKAADRCSGVIKSGGKTRRAAKMVIMDVDHPDIREFINCKLVEEAKAEALIRGGYSSDFDAPDGAYATVAFQNANHSVRVTDDFMLKSKGKENNWDLISRTNPSVVLEKVNASELLDEIATAIYKSGDPGIQFHDTINRYNPCYDPSTKEGEIITASNPCSEFMFLNETSCNLGSFNLLKFYTLNSDNKREFNLELFEHCVRIATIAQDMIISISSFPTEEISKKTKELRPIGLGFANLGALLMHMGLPYDSKEACKVAGDIACTMNAVSMDTSLSMSIHFLNNKHMENEYSYLRKFYKIQEKLAKLQLPIGVNHIVDNVRERVLGKIGRNDSQIGIFGLRNMQLTAIAPTGTIGLMMDCDTTGIEPDISLVKYKKLVGGGTMTIENNSIVPALIALGYNEKEITSIIGYVRVNGTVEGCALLKNKDIPVFDCANSIENGRSISPIAHLNIMRAVQPYVSGAISKTVNMPNSATTSDILNILVKSWEYGLKSVAIYRDGSKYSQPLNTKLDNNGLLSSNTIEVVKPTRKKLPNTRNSMTHKVNIAGKGLIVTLGKYEDGTLGEVFASLGKEGSIVSGLLNSVSIAISLGLQYGVPPEVFIEKFKGTTFEPCGFTDNEQIRTTKSIIDYIAQFIELNNNSHISNGSSVQIVSEVKNTNKNVICTNCGADMVQNGTCHKCDNCGSTTGCG